MPPARERNPPRRKKRRRRTNFGAPQKQSRSAARERNAGPQFFVEAKSVFRRIGCALRRTGQMSATLAFFPSPLEKCPDLKNLQPMLAIFWAVETFGRVDATDVVT